MNIYYYFYRQNKNNIAFTCAANSLRALEQWLKRIKIEYITEIDRNGIMCKNVDGGVMVWWLDLEACMYVYNS